MTKIKKSFTLTLSYLKKKNKTEKYIYIRTKERNLFSILKG